jgi:hypothetical protein
MYKTCLLDSFYEPKAIPFPANTEPNLHKKWITLRSVNKRQPCLEIQFRTSGYTSATKVATCNGSNFWEQFHAWYFPVLNCASNYIKYSPLISLQLAEDIETEIEMNKVYIIIFSIMISILITYLCKGPLVEILLAATM